MDRKPSPIAAAAVFLSLVVCLQLSPKVSSASFKIVNKCRRTVWPGLLSGANTAQLSSTGFSLRSGESKTITIPQAWSGRIWGRTLCGQDPEIGQFACVTGDCGSGKVECAGSGAKPPATLAEFTLNGAGGLDFYDVSLVDGYNLPMLVIAKGKERRAANASSSGGSCSATGCLIDLNGACPRSLRVARDNHSRAAVACRSACEAFGDPQYCCSGAYSTPDTCPPSPYSLFFKNACPRSYSYAYDDKTSTYTCASGDYIIIFCPLPFTSQKVLSARNDGAPLPLVNKSTMYLPSRHPNSASSFGLDKARFSIVTASVLTAHILYYSLLSPS